MFQRFRSIFILRRLKPQKKWEFLSPETGQNPLEELYTAFGNVIRDEDYVAAASSHRGLNSGNLEFLTFGRNEPALHHYHNTYREALGLQKLPLIKS